jgi:hypothetical protein
VKRRAIQAFTLSNGVEVSTGVLVNSVTSGAKRFVVCVGIREAGRRNAVQ